MLWFKAATLLHAVYPQWFAEERLLIFAPIVDKVIYLHIKGAGTSRWVTVLFRAIETEMGNSFIAIHRDQLVAAATFLSLCRLYKDLFLYGWMSRVSGPQPIRLVGYLYNTVRGEAERGDFVEAKQQVVAPAHRCQVILREEPYRSVVVFSAAQPFHIGSRLIAVTQLWLWWCAASAAQWGGREVDFGRGEYWADPTGVQPRANSSTENMGVCVCVSGGVWVGDRKTGRQSVCTGCDWPAYRVLRVEPWGGAPLKPCHYRISPFRKGTGTRWGQQWTSELINFYSALNHQ